VPGPAWESAPSIREFIRTLSRKDRAENCYVLVNALGAGEYYGSNINADFFPWASLSHEGEDYGYRTFLNAHAFAHHANKDPQKAFGVPVVSVLNPRMKRVELVIRLNRAQALAQGVGDVIVRIDNGEFPDVSMGCKVPYDVCSICANQAKTKDDYCEHIFPPEEMRGIWGKNKILSDGRRICMVNTRPRFFDISFVFIGADKTAKVMAKLASKGAHVCLGSVCALPSRDGAAGPELYGPSGAPLDLGALRKTASAGERRGPCGRCCASCEQQEECEGTKLASSFGVKMATQSKLSEIVKRVPAGRFATKTVPSVASAEPDLDDDVLSEMAGHPLPSALHSATSAGLVLKPREFQRLVLIRMGEEDFADDLDEAGEVFRPVHRFDDRGSEDLEVIARIVNLLLPYLPARSAFHPHLGLRAMRTVKKALPTPTPVEHPVLDKLSAAYNGYRRSVLTKLSQAREEVLGDSKLRSAVLGEGLVSMFTKTASADSFIDLDTVAYLMSAHLPDRAMLCTTAVAGAVAVANPWLLHEEHSA
jgi:hypothetical protein